MKNNKVENGYDISTIWLYDQKEEEQREECSLLAYDKSSTKVLAVGKAADAYQYQSDDQIMVMSPLKQGRIANFEEAVALLKGLLEKLYKPTFYQRMKIMLCVPEKATQVEQRAYADVLYQIGAKDILVVEKSFAEMKHRLPPDFRFLIAIVPSYRKIENEKEHWEVVDTIKIPKGCYQLQKIMPQEQHINLVVGDEKQQIHLFFETVSALRVVHKSVISSSLYPEAILYHFPKQPFSDLIYQVHHGEFSSFLHEKGSGIKDAATKSFAVICMDCILEIIAIRNPEITIIKESF